MKMELYLVRHGETLWNRERKYYGHSDIGLTQDGIAQAQEIGRFTQKTVFDKVIVSPLLRAKETAKELTNQDYITDERLMEQNFGLFEGHTYEELKKEYPKELDDWNSNFTNYCIPEGESFSMVRERADSFLEDLKKESGKILLVAHKGTFGHILASLLHLPVEGYWHFVFEQGTCSRIDWEDGYAILRYLNASPDTIMLR
ncbi:MAG: alpha-ribazole phosphatase [Lachnospiraceae bacterium]|nr:alpha-ribazole phosphatase [Lachnospiraceae bacterium]